MITRHHESNEQAQARRQAYQALADALRAHRRAGGSCGSATDLAKRIHAEPEES